MNAKVIESADWNFDAVPDRELVACCYWEYARLRHAPRPHPEDRGVEGVIADQNCNSGWTAFVL